MQLRHKFFLALSLLTAVPLLVLLFGVVERVEREITVRTEQELHATLDKMADELELLLNSQMSIAKGLSRVPALRQVSAAASDNDKTAYPKLAEHLEEFFLNYQHAVPSIQALRFIEPGGKTLVKVKEGKSVPAQMRDPASGRLYVADQSRKSFFQRALAEKGDVSMSDFELGQVTLDADFCPAMVRYSVKLKDELEGLEGLLVVNMWGKRVDTTVEASLGGYPGKPYIVELNSRMEARDGIYLYHPENAQRFADQLGTDFRLKNQLTAAEWEAINTNELGSLYRSDGRMLFYRRFAPYKDAAAEWALVIETASDQILAPVNNLRRGIWALLAAVLLGSLLVAIWAAMRLTRPVNELADIITRYADGDHSVRFKGTGSDEIGSAGRAFNYLTSSL
ncbi:MAG: methyl-accepting chemotaxis protein, partial [Pseudomonadota bacterium]